MRANVSRREDSLRIGAAMVPVARLKRVELVVSDCDISGSVAAGVEPFGRQGPCTIPLALLDGDVTQEELRRLAQAFHTSEQKPIRPEAFLQLLSDIVFFRQRCDVPPTAVGIDRARVERLTRRERQVLKHIVAGHPNKLTAVALDISRRTVEHHRAAIMQKTRAKSVSELVRLALRTGLSGEAEEGVA